MKQEEFEKYDELPEDYIVDSESIKHHKRIVLEVDGRKAEYDMLLRYILIQNGRLSHRCNVLDEKEFNIPMFTYKQWRQLKDKKQDKMEKEIIGYKLVKKEYEQAAFDIANRDVLTILKEELYRLSVKIHDISIPKLKKAGVLDLWFEPVYKSDKTILKFGEVEFEIEKGKGASTKYGYVTKDETKQAIDYIENPPTIAGYKLKTKWVETEAGDFNIRFGCQMGRFSELVAIYEAMK